MHKKYEDMIKDIHDAGYSIEHGLSGIREGQRLALLKHSEAKNREWEKLRPFSNLESARKYTRRRKVFIGYRWCSVVYMLLLLVGILCYKFYQHFPLALFIVVRLGGNLSNEFGEFNTINRIRREVEEIDKDIY